MDRIDICQELHQNFIDFAFEANSQRAFPDARDGLKPGQRACLWEMYVKGYTSVKPHVKSAKVSGGVIASWHPHGDVAVYETFARMSQPWINNIPEVDWHGANGNQIIGSSPASSRYTEARLAKVTEDGMLNGLKKNVVPMIPNFSEDEEWPSVLPAIFPRLLVNGSQGIGVTIANTWLPMNLAEVTDIIVKYLESGVVETDQSLIDFPTGGIIINKDDIPQIHKTGKGKVILRAKAEIKKNTIQITELPYQVYVEPLLEEIKGLILKEELKGIKDVYNKSDKKGLLIEVECEDSPEKVLAALYATTDLQKTYSANQWALVSKTPQLLNLAQYIKIYTEHNLECIRNEYKFDLAKAQARKEIVDGLVKALEDIDNIIALIKRSESSAAAKQNLITKYQFTDRQAAAIVDMKLGRLAHLEKVELNQEQAELMEKIENALHFLNNSDMQKSELKQRLITFTKKYGGPRHTELTQIELSKDKKEIVEVIPQDCIVIATQSGTIKRVPTSNFKAQRRNGKGVKTEDDAILDTISTNTVDTLMMFTDSGKMYRVNVNDIPEGANGTKGVAMSSIVKSDPQEKLIAITSLHKKTTAKYVIFITKQGLLKKTAIEEYEGGKKTTGIAAIKLKEGDSIANVTFADEENFILVTKKGYVIKIETKDIAAIGRIASGVKAIKLSDNDEVLIGLPVKHNDTDSLAVFTKDGLGKRTALIEYPIQGRAGKGLLTIAKEQEIVGAELVSNNDFLLLIGRPNSICISAVDIPTLLRVSAGNMMIKGSKLTKVIKL